MNTSFRYNYIATIKSVYDGDGAYDAVVDLGMKLYLEKQIRLYGVDTPELKGKQKYAGRIVRDFVRTLILDKKVVIYTQRDKKGKYGRLLASITLEDGQDLATLLIEKKYAKPYFGKKKDSWTEEELAKITL